MVIVTHHPDDVRALADSVIFLDQGRVLLHESKTQFLDHIEIPSRCGVFSENEHRLRSLATI